jgi:MoaA/NifB/PqqE/SkfB family radical SAM enzyme
MISILILTHNRPKLFERAIKSIMDNLPDYPVEIIVNNDSNDIEEIDGATYYYEKHKDLSYTYKFLLDKATQEYIYFLEDDDYLLPKFFSKLDFKYDINFINYRHEDINDCIDRFKRDFAVEEEDFQLGQILFKKSLVKEFPIGNILGNDWKLFKSLDSGSMKLIEDILWVQTTDGKDNISFPEYNKDKRFMTNNTVVSSGSRDFSTLYFSWFTTSWCNYKCTYCSVARSLDDKLDKNTAYSSYALVLNKLKRVTKPFVIELLGGEPSIHSNIFEILEELNNIENCTQIELITNLSRSYRFYATLADPKFSKVELTASYHFEYYDHKFLEKLGKLNDLNKIDLSVSVNLPPDSKYWANTQELLEFLKERDIRAMINFLHSTPDWTSDYPEDFFDYFSEYFEEEKIEFVFADGTTKLLYEHEVIEQHLNRFKGYSCMSLSYDISKDGSIRRSCNNGLINLSMSNLEERITCPVDTCDCYTLLQFHKEKSYG